MILKIKCWCFLFCICLKVMFLYFLLVWLTILLWIGDVWNLFVQPSNKLNWNSTFWGVPTRTEGIVKWQVFRNHLRSPLEGPGIWSYICKSWVIDSFLFVTFAACLGHSHMVLPFFVELHKMFGLNLWRWNMTRRFQNPAYSKKTGRGLTTIFLWKSAVRGSQWMEIQPNSWDGECTGSC